MSETPKTILFLAVAALIGLAAWFFRPAPLAQETLQIGQKLVADVDPTSASSLEIVRFNEQSSEKSEFKVERDGDQWVIASHNDYPADAQDAQDRIRDVALNLMDTEILKLASEVATDHAELGVVDPTSEQAKDASAEDVGLLVKLQDAAGTSLANLVIGKTYADDASQRFVRRAGESEVYTAKIDVDKLSSKFEDWIEPNLLNVNSSAVKGVTIKDYNFDVRLGRTPDGRIVPDLDYDPRMEVKVDWNATDSSWSLAELLEARGQRLVPAPLTDDEELNKEKLDELKRAIDDLKIVNVESKPKELVDGVKSDQDLLTDPKIMPSLAEKGYYPVKNGDKFELLSSNGEVRVQTDDGIEYILRFGRTAGVEEVADDAKLNRYLLVSARVVDEHFQPKPAETTPATEAPAVAPAAGQAVIKAKPGRRGAAGADQSAAETANPAEKSTTEAPDEKPSTTPPGSAEADELAQKRKETEAKVDELNKKFSKWYYIISEDVYKKLHLGRFDIIKEKGDSSFGLDELEGLPDDPSSLETPPSGNPQPDGPPLDGPASEQP